MKIDSAGPGHFRGGAAVLRDTVWKLDAGHSLTSLRYKNAAGFGAQGGKDGARGGIWMFEPGSDGAVSAPDADDASYRDATPWAGVVDPETHLPSDDGDFVYPFSADRNVSRANSVIRYVTNAGGGWGDPFTRDPQKVLIDVRDQYVSVDGAARDYGVVVIGDPENDPEGLVVDEQATNALRKPHTGNTQMEGQRR